MVAHVQLPTQGADQAENLGTRGGEEGRRDVRAVPQFLCYLLDSLAGRRDPWRARDTVAIEVPDAVAISSRVTRRPEYTS